jgi:hypothetical protein
MTTYYYMLLTVFAVIVFMIAVDANVGAWIYLQSKMFIVNIKRWIFMVRFHPNNPIPKWTMEWRLNRISKQLQKEAKSNGDV